MSALRRRRGVALTPATWLLTGELLLMIGVSALFPVVPLYVRRHGGGAVDAALFIAGPLLANALVQFPAGRLIDRVGRRPVMTLALAGFACLSALLALDRGPLWLLAAFRAGQGVFGGAYFPAIRAALSDLTPPEQRAERFGVLQAYVMVGILVGPAIGGAIALVHDSLIFACSGGAAAVTTVLIALRVPETKGRALQAAVEAHETVRLAAPGWWRTRGIVVPMIGLAATGVVMSMYDVVWPLYLNGRGYGTVVIGLSVTLYAVPMLLLSRYAGRLADRGDRRLILGGSYAVAGLTAMLYPWLRSLGVILGLGLVEATAWTGTEPTLYAVITDASPHDARGRAMSFGGFAEFTGSAVGALGLGSLYAVGEGIPFWTAAGVVGLAATLCVLFVPPHGPRAVRPVEAVDAAAPVAGVVDAEEAAAALAAAR